MNKPLKQSKLKCSSLNILIPMAGDGNRFKNAGYTSPKPLIEVHGKPMIQLVVDNLGFDANYIFVVRKSHYKKYNLKNYLNLITPNCKIVVVNHLTEGAACTTLLAKEYINHKNPLIIANSDQFIEWNHLEFYCKVVQSEADGGILTFKSSHPNCSYVKLNGNGHVTELREKDPFTNIATVGIYYFRHGSEYVRYAEQMISKNLRVNNEFYVAPVYNEYIHDSKKIKTFDVDEMYGLGIPEDLDYFLKVHSKEYAFSCT
jgi:dTDP-glucose pyrophosphorylase